MPLASPLNVNRCWRSRTTGVEAWTSEWHCEPQCRHAHDVVQISRVTAGCGTIRWQGQAREVAAGQIVVLPAEAVHELTPSGRRRWQFATLYIPEFLWAVPRCGLPDLLTEPGLLTAFDALHVAVTQQGSLFEQQDLLQGLIAQARRLAGADDGIRVCGDSMRQLSQIREALLSDSGCEVSLTELAQAAGLSAGHLHRVFRRSFGLPPHAYLVQARVNHARRLLQAGASIVDAAATAGFADQSHLTRHFKRLVGLTPGRYVERIRPNDQDRSRPS